MKKNDRLSVQRIATIASLRRRASMTAIACTLLFAGAFGITPPADGCHLPENLRAQEATLTAAQMALVSHGSASQQHIAYSLKQATSCADGLADIFSCNKVDLLAHLPLSEIGGGSGNDIWGWADDANGREYALIGRTNGTAFIDITDPEQPIYLGNLPTAAGTAAWRDIKTYRNHAFIVADFAGAHGMQVFDLTQLRGVSEPQRFSANTIYDGFNRAHNIAINEDSGFAYAVGSETCSGGGLHMVDIRDPLNPQFAGCFGEDGYTHDVQCVIYNGPDTSRRGREICFAANEDTVTVVDVTSKNDPQQLSRTGYDGTGYVHQGWLTEDHAFFIQDDELDERQFGHNTKTYIWDMADLTNPRLAGAHMSPGSSIDHNQYIKGRFTYQANYRRGLRILRLSDLAGGALEEVAFFDSYPEADGMDFDGAWSVYPYLRSGAILLSDINRGLFVLRARLGGGGGGGGSATGATSFADDFESGGVESWSKKRLKSLEVVSPGLKGSSFAVRAAVDGNSASFLGSTHPARETGFRATVLLDPNGVVLPSSGVSVLQMLNRKTVVAELVIEPNGSGYRLALNALDGGTMTFIGSTVLPDRAVEVGIEWEQASSATAADGSVRLVKKKRTPATSDTIANGDLFVDEVRVGLPDGSVGSGSAFLIDDYQSAPIVASAAAESVATGDVDNPAGGTVVRSTPKRRGPISRDDARE